MTDLRCPLCKNFDSCMALGISGDKDCGMFVLNEPQSDSKHDPVNHPTHYTAGGIECIDAIAAALACHTEPVGAWLTGQVLKHMWRWPLKNGVEDLRKARFYLDRLIGDDPAADVAPVVRCGECRYAYDSVGGWCCSHGVCVDCTVPEDFFCADGKRKGGEA